MSVNVDRLRSRFRELRRQRDEANATALANGGSYKEAVAAVVSAVQCALDRMLLDVHAEGQDFRPMWIGGTVQETVERAIEEATRKLDDGARSLAAARLSTLRQKDAKECYAKECAVLHERLNVATVNLQRARLDRDMAVKSAQEEAAAFGRLAARWLSDEGGSRT